MPIFLDSLEEILEIPSAAKTPSTSALVNFLYSVKSLWFYFINLLFCLINQE